MDRKSLGQFLLILFGLFLSLSMSGCAPRQPLGEEFQLGQAETIVISGTRLKITIDEIGREWRGDPMEEYPYAIITAKLGAETKRLDIQIGNDMTIGDFNIHIGGCDPFGEPYCSLLVTDK